MEDKDRRTVFVEECARKAADQAAFAIQRNMGLFLDDLRRMAGSGLDDKMVMCVRLTVRRWGDGCASVTPSISWNCTKKYTDDDYDEAEVNINQPELPFAPREDEAAEDGKPTVATLAAEADGLLRKIRESEEDGFRALAAGRSWANLLDAAREIGRQENRAVRIWRQCFDPAVEFAEKTLECYDPSRAADGWKRVMLKDEDEVAEAIRAAHERGDFVLVGSRMTISTARLLRDREFEVTAMMHDREQLWRRLLDGAILCEGYTIEATR